MIVRDDVELTLLTLGPFAFGHRRAYARALGSQRFALRTRPSARLDLIWHPANGTFFSCKLPSIVTIHDAVPFRFPDPDPKRRRHAQQPFLRSARTADRVIAVSAFGRDEIRELLGIGVERIVVIYHGVEPSFSPGPAQGLPGGLIRGRYLLFVGDPVGEPRKNFHLLYDAYRRAWPSGGAPPLAVAGPRAPDLPGVVHAGNQAEDLSARGDSAMRALYRGAIALAMASYHETFGMPMIEAMACGTPVIASQASCLPEIGGDAAIFAPPHDAAAWASALRRVCDDASLRDRLRIAGLHRAARFNWDESAARHLELFAAVART
jgi:glycosyltransferase involved in cell wall biosynthesis